jgi:hypothetical protein
MHIKLSSIENMMQHKCMVRDRPIDQVPAEATLKTVRSGATAPGSSTVAPLQAHARQDPRKKS